MKTLARVLGITKFPFEIKNKHGFVVYYESKKGDWWIQEINRIGRNTYYEDQTGGWRRTVYYKKRGQTMCKMSYGEIIYHKPLSDLNIVELSDRFKIPVDQLRMLRVKK